MKHPLRAGLFAALAATLPCGEIPAQPTDSEGHVHKSIDVDARPIVSRLKVSVVRPRRLLVHRGTTYVADWDAGSVFKLTAKGKIVVLASDLDEPAGLALDSHGNLYVTLHGQGMPKAGALLRFSPAGQRTIVAEGFSGPSAVAVDAQQNAYVACFQENAIVRVSADGTLANLASVSGPSDLQLDAAGYLYCTSAIEGTLSKISPMGVVTVVARGLASPSDLFADQDGRLYAVNFGSGEIMHVKENGRTQLYATVPKGTISADFDPKGNLLLANWDYQLLMRVTTHLQIPCPHCGKAIRIRLRPAKKTRPIPKTAGPVI